jgi:hypothetical protein
VDGLALVIKFACSAESKRENDYALLISALSENLTERSLLRNFLHPLNREEPTLVTAIRLGRG